MRRRNTGDIGIHFGSEALHMLQFEQRAGEPHLRARSSLPYPEDRDAALAAPETLSALWREALRRQPFRGRRVVTALPDPAVKLMVLNYVVDAGQPEPNQILRLVAERVEVPVAECVVDYLPIRTSGDQHGSKSALVAVAGRETVIRHLELLRKAGIRVEALEIPPVAVRRLIVRLAGAHTQRNSITLDCGVRRTSLVVLAGRRLVLYQEIDFGEEQAAQEVSRALDVDADAARSMLRQYGVGVEEQAAKPWTDAGDADEIGQALLEILMPSLHALSEQVAKASRYTASQWRGAIVDQVHLLGHLCRWPGVARVLSGLVGIPVQALDPLAAFPTAAGRGPAPQPGSLGEVALAAGFALRGIEADE